MAFLGGLTAVVWVALKRRESLRLAVQRDIETFSGKLREFKSVWGIITGADGENIKLESLKAYLRVKMCQGKHLNLKRKVPSLSLQLQAKLFWSKMKSRGVSKRRKIAKIMRDKQKKRAEWIMT